MVDLETMGTGTDAAIVSIGAVEFDPENGGQIDKIGGADYHPILGADFYTTVNLQSSLDAGLTVDGKTVYWWLEQSEEARKALLKSNIPGGPISLSAALQGLGIFWEKSGAECLWAHGPSFDTAILNTAYKKLALPQPWSYNAARDTRTVYQLSGWWPKKDEMLWTGGTVHNALDDAKNQAMFVHKAYRLIQRVSDV
jgi:hypothetical protein